MVRTAFLLIFVVTVSLTLVACRELVIIRIHNQTDETLQIFTDDAFIGEAVGGGQLKWKIEYYHPTYKIIAKDTDGNTVYAKTFTREELIRNKWRVVIPPTAKGTQQTDNTTGK